MHEECLRKKQSIATICRIVIQRGFRETSDFSRGRWWLIILCSRVYADHCARSGLDRNDDGATAHTAVFGVLLVLHRAVNDYLYLLPAVGALNES